MLHAAKSVTINRPRQEVYEFWRELENLPRFMQHLEAVTATGERPLALGRQGAGRHHGRVGRRDRRGSARRAASSWRSLAGSDVPNEGSVRFADAPADRGTEVRVELQLRRRRPAAPARLIAKLFGEEPGQQIARRPAALQAGDGDRRSRAVRRQPRRRRAGRLQTARRAGAERKNWRRDHEGDLLDGQEDGRSARRPGPEDPESARRDRAHHLDRDLRLGPPPLQRLHADDEEGRRPRPRVHGRGDGGRPRRQEPQGRRPRGGAVHHRLRQLLALPARHAGRCARTPTRTPRWPRR